MGIRQSIELRPKELLSASSDAVRAYMSKFTKERPMMVSQGMYDALAKRPELKDIMIRVRVRARKPDAKA